MQVADTFFSHPDKNYNDHIDNISQSFDDENHKVVANYHDLGKLSDKFQIYISLKQKENEDNKAFAKRRNKLKTTHTLESGYLYFSNESRREEQFLANFFAIIKHHGSLSNIKEEMNSYLSTIDNYIDDTRLESIEDIAIKSNIKFDNDIYEFMDFFEDLYEESFYQSIESFFLFKKRYSRLILADKFEAIFNEPYENIECLKKNIINDYIQNMVDIIATKPKNRFRNEAKEAIFRNYEKNKNSNIYLIKAPTGVGKTFIALELALTIAKERGDKRRIITAIPFTSIIDQTHQEYEGILGKDKVLKYHHLSKYKEKKQEDEKEQFSQKVFLTDIWHEHFIVTTFNQLLYTLFSNHNRDNVRLETLRDSVIIVDEVQNIPRVLISSIVKIFERFAKEYNIHFIIMSATMPSFEGLLESASILSEDWFYKEKKNRYRLHFKSDINSIEALTEEINSSDNSLLCVVNTIDKAKMLFAKINGQEREDKFLLTTHQIPLHRQEIITEIKKALICGKKIKLISTQLIEAGVDLDFDVGYREFAPFGSIIQMAGRVNREGKKGISDVFVFDFLEIEGQSEKVKRLPYRDIDLQEDNTLSWLATPLEEIKILENLETYFKKVKDETSAIDLALPMKNLEFASLFELLNENFMPNQPWKVSLFIEQREHQFSKYIEDRNDILDNPKYDVFEAMNRVKDLEKDLGLYTITVNNKLIDKLRLNYSVDEKFGRFILGNNNPTYTKYMGFNPEYTQFEEMFDDMFN
jgi:CRISPR-associated endonuclease/helicase Cas3